MTTVTGSLDDFAADENKEDAEAAVVVAVTTLRAVERAARERGDRGLLDRVRPVVREALVNFPPEADEVTLAPMLGRLRRELTEQLRAEVWSQAKADARDYIRKRELFNEFKELEEGQRALADHAAELAQREAALDQREEALSWLDRRKLKKHREEEQAPPVHVGAGGGVR
jgi:hypothetical protein